MSIENNNMSKMTSFNDKLKDNQSQQWKNWNEHQCTHEVRFDQLEFLAWEQEQSANRIQKLIQQLDSNDHMQAKDTSPLKNMQIPQNQYFNLNIPQQAFIPQINLEQQQLMINPCFMSNQMNFINLNNYHTEKQMLNHGYLMNEQNNENTNLSHIQNQDFIHKFLHLKPMDSQIGEVGGVFDEEQYDLNISDPHIEESFFMSQTRMWQKQPSFVNQVNEAIGQQFINNNTGQIQNSGQTKNQYIDCMTAQKYLQSDRQATQINSQKPQQLGLFDRLLQNAEKDKSNMQGQVSDVNNPELRNEDEINTLVKQSNESLKSEALNNVKVQDTDCSEHQKTTLDFKHKKISLQTPSAQQLRQKTKGASIFGQPEIDLTNASSQRSIKIDNCKEFKIEKTEEEEMHIDKLLMSPRFKNESHDRRTYAQMEIDTQLEENTDQSPLMEMETEWKNVQKTATLREIEKSSEKDEPESVFENSDSTDSQKDQLVQESDSSNQHSPEKRQEKAEYNLRNKSTKLKSKSKAIHKQPKQTGIKRIGAQKTKFDFFFHRTCFRTMNEYYKQQFQNFYENYTPSAKNDKQAKGLAPNLIKNLITISKEDMDDIMQAFLQEILEVDLFSDRSPLTELQKLQMKNSMIMFAQAHRSSKHYLFLDEMHAQVKSKRKELKSEKERNQIYSDFDLVRDVQYKYSKRAQEVFFNKPIENYFFIKYAESKKGMRFLQSKPAAQEDQVKGETMTKHTKDLKIEAMGILNKLAQGQGPDQGMIKFFLQDLRSSKQQKSKHLQLTTKKQASK